MELKTIFDDDRVSPRAKLLLIAINYISGNPPKFLENQIAELSRITGFSEKLIRQFVRELDEFGLLGDKKESWSETLGKVLIKWGKLGCRKRNKKEDAKEKPHQNRLMGLSKNSSATKKMENISKQS